MTYFRDMMIDNYGKTMDGLKQEEQKQVRHKFFCNSANKVKMQT